jgi:hypothetical protein
MSTEEPTNSGRIEDLRDQIFLPFIAPPLFFILDRKASMKAPFQRDLELHTRAHTYNSILNKHSSNARGRLT